MAADAGGGPQETLASTGPPGRARRNDLSAMAGQLWGIDVLSSDTRLTASQGLAEVKQIKLHVREQPAGWRLLGCQR